MKQDDHGGESSLTHDQQVIGGGKEVVWPPRMVQSLRFPPGRGDRRNACQFPSRGETGAAARDQRAEGGSRHKGGGNRPGAERATRNGHRDHPKVAMHHTLVVTCAQSCREKGDPDKRTTQKW